MWNASATDILALSWKISAIYKLHAYNYYSTSGKINSLINARRNPTESIDEIDCLERLRSGLPRFVILRMSRCTSVFISLYTLYWHSRRDTIIRFIDIYTYASTKFTLLNQRQVIQWSHGEVFRISIAKLICTWREHCSAIYICGGCYYTKIVRAIYDINKFIWIYFKSVLM